MKLIKKYIFVISVFIGGLIGTVLYIYNGVIKNIYAYNENLNKENKKLLNKFPEKNIKFSYKPPSINIKKKNKIVVIKKKETKIKKETKKEKIVEKKQKKRTRTILVYRPSENLLRYKFLLFMYKYKGNIERRLRYRLYRELGSYGFEVKNINGSLMHYYVKDSDRKKFFNGKYIQLIYNGKKIEIYNELYINDLIGTGFIESFLLNNIKYYTVKQIKLNENMIIPDALIFEQKINKGGAFYNKFINYLKSTGNIEYGDEDGIIIWKKGHYIDQNDFDNLYEIYKRYEEKKPITINVNLNKKLYEIEKENNSVDKAINEIKTMYLMYLKQKKR